MPRGDKFARKIQRAYRASKARQRLKRIRSSRKWFKRVPRTPLQKNIKLKYVDTITLNPGLNSITNHTFCANGVYDPDVSGVGHQPQFFDQVMVFADHYTVKRSHISVSWVPIANASTDPGLFGVILDDNTSLDYANARSVIESNQIQPSGYAHCGINDSLTKGKFPTVQCDYVTSKFFNVKDYVSQDLYRGTVSSNPTEAANFNVWYGSIAGNDPASQVFLVEIVYELELSEFKYVTTS